MNIGLIVQDEASLQKGEDLAKDLDVRILNSIEEAKENNYSCVIVVSSKGIGIKEFGTINPIYVDYNNDKITYRRKSQKKEIIYKAFGLNNIKNPIIVDATCGLGTDSFVIASFGYKIHMIERSKFIGALVASGLERGSKDKNIQSLINNMILHIGNSITLLGSLSPDIVYLDPMFPEKTKSALVKKEMRVIRQIVQNDDDASSLLEEALKQAKYRVIVKRPRKAAPLAGIKPSYKLEGSSSRFDIYITKV
jgi:16S rRNA (guanine1516-N2)-methyltransferase